MENVDGMPNTTQNYELVYAIQSKNLKHVKIGYTTDINQRLSSLQGGSSDELKIIGCWLGTVQDERQLHEQLRRWRIHREWFQDSEDVLKVVAEKNQALKSDTVGKLILPLSKGKHVEIWESRRVSDSEKYTARPGLGALVDLVSKAQQLSEDLPPHHGKIADQIVKDARAAYDALEILQPNAYARQAVSPRRNNDDCIFCFRQAGQVGRMLAGDIANICNECTIKAYSILLCSEPEKRHCFQIQCGKDYIYSAETKADALRLWACDYSILGETTSVVTAKQLNDDGKLTYHYEPEENKQPETKTFKEWAIGKAGFIAVYRETHSLDVPELAATRDKLVKAEAEVKELKQKLSDATTEAFHLRAQMEAMAQEIARLSSPRLLTMRERMTGQTQSMAA